jgi:CheY-like chemotaxis protein
MPGIDGFETAAAIRSLERLRRVPILFVSAGADRRAKERERNPYCEFLRKPLDPDVVRRRVAAYLEPRPAHVRPDTAAALSVLNDSGPI